MTTFAMPTTQHDFGAFETDGQVIFFKIDYYDKALTCQCRTFPSASLSLLVLKWSKLLRPPCQADAACSGGRERRANMDQFIRTQNVERYRRLLERVTEESARQTIFNLVVEEQQKQKDAGDRI
jgi:hypothetical protein